MGDVVGRDQQLAELERFIVALETGPGRLLVEGDPGIGKTEAQIARLAAAGLTDRDVAAAAFCSLKTVEANISRIYRKLGIHSRAELGAWMTVRDQLSNWSTETRGSIPYR